MEQILIKFTKKGPVKFISHLDLLRTFGRAFRRAQLPLYYSQGFNPHPSISVAAPLSLGVESDCEYMEVKLDSKIDEDIIINSLNNNLPEGIRIIDAIYYSKRDSLMSLVKAAKYFILIDGIDNSKLLDAIEKIKGEKEIFYIKKGKSGERNVDARPLILDLNIDNSFVSCTIKSGSSENLNPDVVADIIKSYSGTEGYALIIRKETYTYVENKLVGLADFIRM